MPPYSHLLSSFTHLMINPSTPAPTSFTDHMQSVYRWVASFRNSTLWNPWDGVDQPTTVNEALWLGPAALLDIEPYEVAEHLKAAIWSQVRQLQLYYVYLYVYVSICMVYLYVTDYILFCLEDK